MAETSRTPRGAVDPALAQKKRARRRLIGALALLVATVLVLPRFWPSSGPTLVPELVLRDGQADASGQGATSAVPASEDASSDAKAVVSTPSTSADAAREVDRTGSSRAETAKSGVAADPGVAQDAARPDTGKAAARSDSPAMESGRTGDTRPESVRTAPGRAEPTRADAAKPSVPARVAPVDDPIAAIARAREEPRAAAPRPQAAEPSPVAGSRAFVLQVGAYRSQEAAERAAKSVREKGLPVFVESSTANGATLLRVRAGPYRDRDAAQRAREQLSQGGIESAIIAP